MKLLLDTCVWGGVVDALKAAGHDVIWAGDWTTDPGDEEIMALAYQAARILITLDKDFGELAVVREHAHAGIVRLVVMSASQQGPTCLMVLTRYGNRTPIRCDRDRRARAHSCSPSWSPS